MSPRDGDDELAIHYILASSLPHIFPPFHLTPMPTTPTQARKDSQPEVSSYLPLGLNHGYNTQTTMTSAAKKSVLLTGASRGIGLAIARSLLRDGHNVFAVARSSGPLEELKKEAPGQVEFLAGDVADDEVCFLSLYFFSCLKNVVG